MAFKPWWWTEYLMMRMVVVGLWSEGVKTTATSLVSQGCSSRRRTPSPITSSSFSPACSKIYIKKINKISRREIESTKTGIYLGRWRQQSKLWGADVDREGADVKPAKKKKSGVCCDTCWIYHANWEQTIWRGGPVPPEEQGTRREYGPLQTPLKRRDSSAWTSLPKTEQAFIIAAECY